MTQDIFDLNKINKDDIYIKNNHCFILIDTETCNGFDRKNNAIIQIAFKFIGTNYIFNSYCNPDDSIYWKNDYKNFIPKINKENVNNSPNLKEVLLSFKNTINCINDIIPVLIAHNSSFDKNMLELCFNYYNIELGVVKWCNTMNTSFFNIKDENKKNIKSLEKITKHLLQEENINFHNAEDDVKNLNNCLLKIHKNNENIVLIVLKMLDSYEKIDKTFLLEYKNILENFNEFCDFNPKNTVNNIEIINLYEDILKKEKEITNCKNIIKNKIIDLLNNNNNCIYIQNKEIILKEYTMKQLDTKKFKDECPDIYNKYIKNVKYKKVIIKN